MGIWKPTRSVGIVGYGAYVPRFRLAGAEVSRVWSDSHGQSPIEEKAVPDLDEDVVTMSIEAARNAVRRARMEPARLGAVWVAENPNAMFRFSVSAEDFSRAKMVAEPVSVLDSSPIADGAAALVLRAGEARSSATKPAVRIRACSMATDAIALHDRRDPLSLEAAAASGGRAYEAAGIRSEDVDFFEAHDAFSIMTVLSLEACGFAERGRGVHLGASGAITR